MSSSTSSIASLLTFASVLLLAACEPSRVPEPDGGAPSDARVPDACVPDCDGRTCGDDGCGGTCGPGCGLSQTCNAAGRCEIDCLAGCDAETAFNEYVRRFRDDGGHLATDVKILPTVVHVIYDDEADRISVERVISQIVATNADLRRRNADADQTRPMFREAAADTHIEVCLASRDPDGETFEGVVWHHVPGYTEAMLNDLRIETQWNPHRYLNVWVTPLGLGGNATQPWEAGTVLDGFWVSTRQFGTIGDDLKEGFTGGGVFTHELGHYLGLYHTFEDGFAYLGRCDFPDCETTGDHVCDTPLDWNLAVSAEQCEEGRRECEDGTVFYTQSENFMAYAYDDCTNMFSRDQRTRMRAALADRRASLVSAQNLAATGCTAP
jgi:hypothetical protein